MGIAERRHHRERLMRKRRFHWGRDLVGDPRRWGMATTTPCACSCWVCGNQRAHEGATLQERRAMLAANDD